MISARELQRITREMDGLTFYSIETSILKELISVYEQVQELAAETKKETVVSLPPPARSKITDD